MTTALPTTEVFEQFTGRAIEGLSMWADANQKLLKQLADLSTVTASESARLYAELQASAIVAAKTGQDFVIAQSGKLKNLQDPFATYQKTVADGVDGAQQAFKLIEASAGTVTKSAERLQQSAEKVGKDIQGTLATLSTQLKTLYAPVVEQAVKSVQNATT